ncbi:MAG TPA: hypothetical protein VFG86_08610 [Chloroflexota bacterium]|jgi:hypothetical protein|nr:hypothetical protein [Chloroflexota bacterium]
MAEQLRLARPYFVLLAIFAIARLVQGPFGVPYGKGHHVFSLVTLTAFSCIYYGVFTRRWRGYRLIQAILLAFLLGVTSQLAILLLTLVSYGLSLETYFNHPVALNVRALAEVDLRPGLPEPVAFGAAVANRLGGLIGNSIFAGILGAIGWTIGGVLPER